MKNKVILAIETSCDDTSIAIVKNKKLLSNVTLSTTKQHSKYGGIVPEVAARGHESSLYPCMQKALKDAKENVSKLTHIAYTSEPGLPGSLHIGKVFAKTLSAALQIPLVPINHMMGHVFSPFINSKKPIKFPFISLVVSGGHTSIYLFNSVTKFKVLNQTTDDAAGETLDKIGRMLGLKYPGGISIDKIYNPKKTNLFLIKHYQPQASFSFSGLKTHVLNIVNTINMKKQKVDRIAIGSSVLK
jgi:N6-L-threonylcarbamoyladenine synthase